MYVYDSTQGTYMHFLGMKAGDPMAFTVKETPLKKQVDHYRRFKLQRLRCIVQCNIKCVC